MSDVSMLTASIAFPASTEPPNFDGGRKLLEKIEDPSLFSFHDPEDELKELMPSLACESNLIDEDGGVLIEYARRAGRVIIDKLEKALVSWETTFLTVGDYRLYISGGLSNGDSPTEAAEAIWNAYKLPETVLRAMGFIWDYELPLSRANGSGDHAPITDTDVVDAIALGLGTSPEWPGLETTYWIADAISKVRNHPGGRDPREYREEFAEERAFDPREDGFLAKYLNEGTDDLSIGHCDVSIAGGVAS
ncbi:hypothetical protein [Streptomyces sp. NPDC059788]|uniref:hypothetical protein n=1 Tax=Streptomyces sp. NPDC059788 TaxID=3346948 RepID=UPI003655F507